MLEYLVGGGDLVAEPKRSPLFRSAIGRTGRVVRARALQWRATRSTMVAAAGAGDAGIVTAVICNHTFRATGITAYLENGGTLERAQAIAAHESPRTTKLYDRTADQVTLDEIERIIL